MGKLRHVVIAEANWVPRHPEAASNRFRPELAGSMTSFAALDCRRHGLVIVRRSLRLHLRMTGFRDSIKTGLAIYRPALQRASLRRGGSRRRLVAHGLIDRQLIDLAGAEHWQLIEHDHFGWQHQF